MNSIGNRLSALRAHHELSVRDLEDFSGVSKATVCRLERGGYKNPGIDVLRALADALGCSVSHLIGEAPSPVQKRVEELEKAVRLIDDALTPRKPDGSKGGGIRMPSPLQVMQFRALLSDSKEG